MNKTLFAVALATVASFSFGFVEGFDNISTLSGSGWASANRSNPLGALDWFQGNDQVFVSDTGAPTSYIGANFENTGTVGTISNWLFTPTVLLRNGDTLTFKTRTAGAAFPDRLQVRLSTSGTSTDVGTTATSTGVFNTLLLDINPNYGNTSATGFPEAWTEFTVSVIGLQAEVNGRFAFRYFVENAGSNAPNGNYIGIDTVEYASVPEPASLAVIGLGAAALLRRRRK